MENAVEASSLAVRRGGNQVLHGLDFAVPAGRITGLLGPSGCGKSTLLRSIVGVQAGVRGRLLVLGEPAGSPALRARIGYVTQAPSVYPDLTVTENLAFFAKVLGVGPGRVSEVLATVDLAGRADHLVSRLSGGQRSRVSLGAALLGEPELLVLDEPTVGLDPVLRVQLWQMFARIAADGATVLVSSHVMDEAERCDRLLLMREGAFIADGTVAEVKAATGCTDIEQAFLALVTGTPGPDAEPTGAEAR